MNRHISFLLLLLGMAFAVSAQPRSSSRSGQQLFGHSTARFVKSTPHKATVTVRPPRTRTIVEVQEEQVTPVAAPDTATEAFYMNCVKQHGWMRGLGKPISREHASHLSSYLRFSCRNKAGHWTRIENFDGYGRPVNSQMGTYLVNPQNTADSLVDTAWREKLGQVVRWELLGDATGEHCVQENAYDANGQLVYSYIPVKVAENKYMGHYVDAWGMPAMLRGSNGARYVIIEWDENGYEKTVSYIGEDGFPKKNQWDSYMERKTYSKEGFLLSAMSCMPDGRYMIDKAGNCGQRFSVGEYGYPLVATNYDDHNLPVRTTKNEQYVSQRLKYDSLGRNVSVEYSLPDGTPDTTGNGVHYSTIEYNDRGKMLRVAHYGLDGKPREAEPGGGCSFALDYDQWGNVSHYEQRDAKGRLEQFMGRQKWSGSTLLEEWQYIFGEPDDSVLYSHFVYDTLQHVRRKEFPLEDKVNIWKTDADGNVLEDAFFSYETGAPICDDADKGYHKLVAQATHEQGRQTKETWIYNTDGRLMDINDETFRQGRDGELHNHAVEVMDTLNRTFTLSRYDGDRLIRHFRQSRTEDMSGVLGEIGLDMMGKPARTHLGESLFYQASTLRNIKGEFSKFAITNEYGETAYAMSNDSYRPQVFCFKNEYSGVWFDEYNNAISSMQDLRDSLPQACVIEVYDSVAERWGIQSGDVILLYGAWGNLRLDDKLGEAKDYEEWNFYKEFFRLHDKEKRMVVMRRNPDTNQAEYKVIALPKGLPKDFGFYFHNIYYTQKEARRYEKTYQAYRRAYTEDFGKWHNLPKSYGGKHSLYLFRPFRAAAYKHAYRHGLVDNAIILGFVMQDKNGETKVYHIEDPEDRLTEAEFDKDRRISRLWYTTDLKTVQSLECEGEQHFYNIYHSYQSVPNDIYRPAHRLARLARKEMREYVSRLNSNRPKE